MVYPWPCAVLTKMYHFNTSFIETATNLYNGLVVPECLRSLIQFLISQEHILDQNFI